jgi:hypothetical protein
MKRVSRFAHGHRRFLLIGIVALTLGSFLLAPSITHAARHAPSRALSGWPLSGVHTATSGNSAYNYTVIDDLDAFGNSTMVVQVTPSWNTNLSCGCVYDTHTLGVFYTGIAWAIFHEDGTAISAGAQYNVTGYPAGFDSNIFAHSATTANISGDYTVLNNATANQNPNAIIMVTQVWNPLGQCGGCIYNNHQIGVWYTGTNWVIFNEDGAPMPAGASFNVNVQPNADNYTFTRGANSTNYVAEFSASSTDYVPARLIFVTPNATPHGVCPCKFDTHPLGVYYNTYDGRWSVYHQDIAPMVVWENFNIYTV